MRDTRLRASPEGIASYEWVRDWLDSERLSAEQAIERTLCLGRDLHRLPRMARWGYHQHVIWLDQRVRARLLGRRIYLKPEEIAPDRFERVIEDFARRSSQNGLLVFDLAPRPPRIQRRRATASRAPMNLRIDEAVWDINRRPMMPLKLLLAIGTLTPEEAIRVEGKLHGYLHDYRPTASK